MTINLQLPKKPVLKPVIAVFGVGGAGGNAVNNMINSNLEGVQFFVANTDSQALDISRAEKKIHLGEALTMGLGAGSYPEVGRAAAEESMDEIRDYLQGCNMVFITAGMGGGTGTGAAPVIARMAKEMGILTVSVVTKPFHFEGTHRMRVADLGLQELQKFVDTLIVIPNQNLFRVADKSTTFAEAFKMADDVLHSGVRSVTDLMVMPGLINLDFADVRAVMSEMGKAMMGTGESSGENRAVEAAEAAIANPLLDNTSMHGARGVLINITGGPDMTLFEVDEAANRIREEVDQEANIIFGSTFSKELEGKIRVSVVATGIEATSERKQNAGANFYTDSKARQEQKVFNEKIIIAATNMDSGPKSAEEFSIDSFIATEPLEPELPIKDRIESEHGFFKESFLGGPEYQNSPPAENMFYPPQTQAAQREPVQQQSQSTHGYMKKEPVFEAHQMKPGASSQQPAVKPSFFGRFSTTGKSPESSASPLGSPIHDYSEKQTQVKESNYTRQDSLDIPAYMRKKP